MFYTDSKQENSCSSVLVSDSGLYDYHVSNMITGSVLIVNKDAFNGKGQIIKELFAREGARYYSRPFYSFAYLMYYFPGNMEIVVKGKKDTYRFEVKFLEFLEKAYRPGYSDIFTRLNSQREDFIKFCMSIKDDIFKEMVDEIKDKLEINQNQWLTQFDVYDLMNNLLIKLVDMGKYELIEKLLYRNVNVNALALGELAPIHLACYKGDYQMFDYLLSKGADVNLQDKLGNGLIHILAIKWNAQIFEKLLEMKIDLRMKNIDGRSACYYAVKNNNLLALKAFIENGADVEEILENGKNLLHMAVEEDKIGIVKFLSSMLKNIDYVDSKGWSALHYASKAGYANMVSFFLGENVDLNLLTSNKESALTIAKNTHNLRITNMLLAAGADTKEFFTSYNKLLLMTSRADEAREISLFMEHPIDYLFKNNKNQDALLKALKKIYLQEQFADSKDLIKVSINCIEEKSNFPFETIIDICGNLAVNE